MSGLRLSVFVVACFVLLSLLIICNSAENEIVLCNKSEGNTGCSKSNCPDRRKFKLAECNDVGDKSYCQCIDKEDNAYPPVLSCKETYDKSKKCYTDPPIQGAKVEAWFCPASPKAKGQVTCFKRITFPGK